MSAAVQALPGECWITLPNCWVSAQKFDETLRRCGDALGDPFTTIIVRVPAGCKLMVDVIIRLLSFCNQVITMSKRLRLEFEGDNENVAGYLSRMGFFDHLSPYVEVSPARPVYSGATLYRGRNGRLVEIARFSGTTVAEPGLVDRLARTAQSSCGNRADANHIYSAVFTIFGELIGNVSEHSKSPLDGFAALQTYPNGNEVRIAVSDSGIGIIDSLRPALRAKGDPAANLGDINLLVEMFRKGISRHEDQKRGNGLMVSARHAIRFKADLDVRLPKQRVLLKPSDNQYVPSIAYSHDGLPLLWGTHISFALNLT
jgi:hypothetical protein